MSDDRRTIDLEKWLRKQVRILNEMGGRGFDTGVRTFHCPFCRDTKGRGWMTVSYWTAGCFNVGCIAYERLDGGAVEWVRRVEKINTRAETLGFLRREYGTEQPIEFKTIARDENDFVRWPEGMRPLARQKSGEKMDPMRRSYMLFVEKQWNITEADAFLWGLGYCIGGYYASRVVIPIVMFGQPVAFQARGIMPMLKKPKYLTSRYGPKDDPEAECARPASAILYNYDRVQEGGEVVIVEGVGDVMGWHRGRMDRQPTAIAMLGVNLTPEKLALLAAKNLKRIVLAPDAEPEAQKQAVKIYDTLKGWDLPAVLGSWAGGKDAGSGATLREQAPPTLRDEALARLG